MKFGSPVDLPIVMKTIVRIGFTWATAVFTAVPLAVPTAVHLAAPTATPMAILMALTIGSASTIAGPAANV